MFKTVFDENLEDFFYAETCTINSFGYERTSKAGIFNFLSAKIRIPLKAIGAMAFASTLFISSNSAGASLGLLHSKYRYLSKKDLITAGPTKLDERGRLQLVKKLLKIREDFGLTQDDISGLLDVSKSTLSKLERGEHSPDATNLNKYISFLQLSEYLNDKLNGKKFAIRLLFKTKSPVFDGMNAIEFAHTIGEEGLNEVMYTFKRQYG